MTKWMRVMDCVFAAAALGAMAWVGGCSSEQQWEKSPAIAPSGQPASVLAPPGTYSPVGTTQNGDLARFLVPADGWQFDPETGRLGRTLDSSSYADLDQDDLTNGFQLRKSRQGIGAANFDDENVRITQHRALETIRGSSMWRADDEIWVISKLPAGSRVVRGDDCPGTGSMLCVVPTRTDPVPAPLKHTSVRASVVGPAAKVDVTQQFENPFSEKIEAVYVFPLPENGAVTEFVMTVGERRIRAIVRDRQEAEKIYEAARSQGYTAALLTQERPNIFTQKVANIEPGKQVDVAITYYQTVSEMDGWNQWVFPMVVAPRFNPPSSYGVGAVARGDRGDSGQRTEVQYLAPGERTGSDIDVRVDIEAGVPIDAGMVRSPSHQVRISHVSGSRSVVELSRSDRLPNKDLVVEWKTAGGYAKGGLIYGSGRPGSDDEWGGRSGGDESFVLMLVPPENREKLRRAPLEVVFVVDRSGSMDGAPIAQARAAVRRGLERLKSGDTFQIIDFAESSSKLGAAPIEVNDENIRRGMAFVNSMDAAGGTMMMTGLKASLAFPHDPKRLRFVVFLTDGLIGNETEILGAEADRLGDSRVFSFGVGSSPNRFLMDRMAKVGRGVSAYVSINDPESDGARTMDAFMDRVERPVLTDVTIDWNGAQVRDVTPGWGRLPDLFTGRSVVVAGKVMGGFSRPVKVTGRVAGTSVTMEVQPTLADRDGGRAVAAIAARQKLADLEERAIVEGWEMGRYVDSVRRVALENGLVSSYTALVAVDSSVRTAGTSGVSVAVPVPVADGVRYDTTVGGPSEGGGGRGRRD